MAMTTSSDDRQPAPAASGYPRKRARTRRRLMASGMTVLAELGPDGATLNEVARRAEVSPGTVYNHFRDLDALTDAIVDELARGVEIGRAQLDEIEHDPAARVAIGTRQLLELTSDDPSAARAFVTLLATVPAFRRRVQATVAGAIEDGIAGGRFARRDSLMVTDAVIGSVVQWMRSRLAGDAATHGLGDELRFVLTIVGVADGDADEVVAALLDGEPAPGASGERVPGGWGVGEVSGDHRDHLAPTE